MTNLKKILAAGTLVVVLLLGAFIYSVFKTPAAASGPITAIPLAAANTAAASPSPAVQPPITATSNVSTDTPVVDGTATSAAAQIASSTATSTEAAPVTTGETTTTAVATNAPATSGTTTFTIVPAQSEVRFSLTEVLNGAPKTAVGTTNQVAGELAIDPQDPTKSRVGTIQVDARTLATDNDFRNRAIKNQILQTDQYEFITFTPTSVTGLPQQGTVGQSTTLQIAGNLTIRTTTKAVTFTVTVTPTSTTQLKGSAKATISRADFGLTIPQVRQVANVSDQVQIAIDFVAVAK